MTLAGQSPGSPEAKRGLLTEKEVDEALKALKLKDFCSYGKRLGKLTAMVISNSLKSSRARERQLTVIGPWL